MDEHSPARPGRTEQPLDSTQVAGPGRSKVWVDDHSRKHDRRLRLRGTPYVNPLPGGRESGGNLGCVRRNSADLRAQLAGDDVPLAHKLKVSATYVSEALTVSICKEGPEG